MVKKSKTEAKVEAKENVGMNGETAGGETAGGEQSVKQAESVDVSEISKCVNRYVILWRNESKQVARLIGVEGDEILCRMVTGPDKDKGFRAKYFAKTIKVYDEDNLILSITE
jgi:hypothetical protein